METEKTEIKVLRDFIPILERFSRKEIVVISILSVFLILGVVGLLFQVIYGHIVTGMRDNVMWGVFIANFIFFMGLGYSGAVISAVFRLFKVKWGLPLVRMVEIITVISILIGPVYVLLCMGRLDRLQHLITEGRIQSPIYWDFMAINTFIVGSIIFLYVTSIRDLAILRDNSDLLKIGKFRKRIYSLFSLNYKNTPSQAKHLRQAINIISTIIIPIAIILSTILSWIFGMTLRPGWHSTIFGPYFVFASIYSGTGLLIILMIIFRKVYKLEKYIEEKHFRYISVILMVTGAFYGYLTFTEYLTGWYGSESWELELIFKFFTPTFYGVLFFFSSFFGILVPVAICAVPKLRTIPFVTVSGILVVISLWIKRYILIIPTLETPLLPIQDTRLEYITYSPTWVEWSMVAGGFALFITLFIIISKFMPIVSIAEVSEAIDAGNQNKS
ncbi:MAG: NrfD/PsrC family molybdoenzyme membrane anchor subunit [Bacteroidales bacterium]